MRTKILIIKITNMMKWIAISLAAIGVVLVVIQGDFDNEFLRITVLLTNTAFIFYANLHWVIRLIGLVLNVYVLLGLEILYLRETLL